MEPDEFHAIDTVFVGGSTTAFNQTAPGGPRTATWIEPLPFYPAEFDRWFAAESSAGRTGCGNMSAGAAE
ncbi:hypothetical protein QFC20_002598 [Naganishia adeliensis]|uniref:Uncharacterized protein n=1 Tax=Naganishia adeliensis TaxID=92952 RepID=A0ACC2WI44_9TREE|nr:hypothetical protein QFC20_002598 [Naganishia adeliensis]